jgi:two-component system, NarL family, invasion response regulator UvrY
MTADTVAGVLICEDCRALRTVLRIIVDASAGMEVVGEAADGREAVAEARRLQPDVILLDLAMPGCDGVEALPDLRDAAHDGQIIIFSGSSSPGIASRVFALGAAAYLAKGAHPDTIVATIEHVLANRPATAAAVGVNAAAH